MEQPGPKRQVFKNVSGTAGIVGLTRGRGFSKVGGGRWSEEGWRGGERAKMGSILDDVKSL